MPDRLADLFDVRGTDALLHTGGAGNGGVSRAVRYGMNGTMPATVKSSDGSGDTKDADGTTAWPFFSKKSSQRRTISWDFMVPVSYLPGYKPPVRAGAWLECRRKI